MSTQAETVLHRFSEERLRTYRSHCKSHIEVLELYEWNLRMSASLFEALVIVEVVLRNFVHETLSRATHQCPSARWWETVDLKTELAGRLRDAERRAASTAGAPPPGKVVAELNFGFWRFLFTRSYQSSLWPILRKGFARRGAATPARAELEESLGRLQQLRNRIAHHEPVLERNLDRDWVDMVTLIGAICPTTQSWFEKTSAVRETLARRPRHPTLPPIEPQP